MTPDSRWPSGRADDRAMLGAIVDTAGSVIIGLDPDHRIFEWNRAAEALYQTARERAIGLDYVATFIAPEHQAAVAADITQVLAGRATLNFEDDSILPDGSRRTLIWNVTRVLGADGNAVGIVATGQDITERKEAEERFRLVFEHALDGLLISDASGVIDCNPAALRMLGLTDRTDLIGRRPAEFSPPTQPDGASSEAKSRGLGAITLETGAHTFDWVHQHRDGTPVPVEVSVRHAMLNGRRVSVVAWRDQSRRAEIERARAEVEHRLTMAHKLEAVGQLAGGVAHDFNNLLTAIRNSIQLAVHDVSADVAIRPDLELALRSTEQAARLTGQLLAFSRQQLRKPEPVNLAQLIDTILPLLRTSMPSSITVRVTSGVPHATVVADRSQLEQVMLNLVLNARDAMPDGGTLTIDTQLDAAQRRILLTVADTGIGMDDATRERIFEPFFTTKAVGLGTGLGLAVVYGVVRQADGAISVTSAPGRGTRIEISLPAGTTHVEPGQAESPPVPLQRERVLLVDDDDAVRSTTRRLLQRLQFTVLEASTGAEALRLFEAQRETLDVLLTDIRMPEMDGVQLAIAVRRVDPSFPVVFISGFDAVEHEYGDDLGTIPMIAKPFTADRLATVLSTTVSGSGRVTS